MNKEKNNLCIRLPKELHREYKKFCLNAETTMSENLIGYIKSAISLSEFLDEKPSEMSIV